MGLAASQGRYLALTARMSDLIYEGQQIAQQRLNLATETEIIANKYNEAMGNTKIEVIMLNGRGEDVKYDITYDLITGDESEFQGLGYRLVDKNGNVVIPNEGKKDYSSATVMMTEKDENGEDIEVPTSFTNMEDLLNAAYTGEDKDQLKDISFTELKQKYSNDSNFKALFNKPLYFAQSEKYTVDENVKDSKYLQDMLLKGEYLMQRKSNLKEKDGKWENFEWQSNTNIRETYDTSDDAAAESEYEAAMREINRRDKVLELRLEQVQTQESAIEKEIESVKNIIGKNIEDSFKTFSG